jgi:hypothetical protein
MERSARTAMLLGTPARREIRPFEGQQHLMNRGRGQLEEPLDIGLCRWSAIDQRVDVYEREILSLPGREVWVRISCAIHDWPRKPGTSHEHTVPGGIERGGARATHVDAKRR